MSMFIESLIISIALTTCLAYLITGLSNLNRKYGKRAIPCSTPLAELEKNRDLLSRYCHKKCIVGKNWVESGEGISILLKKPAKKILHGFFIGSDDSYKILFLTKDTGYLMEIEQVNILSSAIWAPGEQSLRQEGKLYLYN